MADAQQEEPQKPTDEPASSSSSTWSDANYISALERLQHLQAQIDKLRASLPQLIAPLTTTPAASPISTVPPSSVYTDFANQAVRVTRDVKTLREHWESEETKQILQHSEDSLDKDSDVEWEFVKIARWGDIPKLEATDEDVKMENENKDQDADIKKETTST